MTASKSDELVKLNNTAFKGKCLFIEDTKVISKSEYFLGKWGKILNLMKIFRHSVWQTYPEKEANWVNLNIWKILLNNTPFSKKIKELQFFLGLVYQVKSGKSVPLETTLYI